MDSLKRRISVLKENREKDPLFQANEVQTNKLGALILGISGVAMVIIVVLASIKIVPLEYDTIMPPMIQGIVETVIMISICHYLNYDAWWLKHLLIVGIGVL